MSLWSVKSFVTVLLPSIPRESLLSLAESVSTSSSSYPINSIRHSWWASESVTLLVFQSRYWTTAFSSSCPSPCLLFIQLTAIKFFCTLAPSSSGRKNRVLPFNSDVVPQQPPQLRFVFSRFASCSIHLLLILHSTLAMDLLYLIRALIATELRRTTHWRNNSISTITGIVKNNYYYYEETWGAVLLISTTNATNATVQS